MRQQRKGSRWARIRRKLGRVAGIGGRALATGVLAGLGTYGALRVGGRLLRPAASVMRRKKSFPILRNAIHAIGTKKAAAEWALGTGLATGFGQLEGDVAAARIRASQVGYTRRRRRRS